MVRSQWSPTVLASLQSQLAQVKVRVWRGSDNHHVDRGVLDHLIGRPEGLEAGVILLRIVIRLGGTLHDRIELQLWDLLHERNVEDLCAKAVADNADVVDFGDHCDCQAMESEGMQRNEDWEAVAFLLSSRVSMADAGEGPGDGNVWLRRGIPKYGNTRPPDGAG